MQKLGFILIVVSFLPWLSAFIVPFLALSVAQKAFLIPSLFISGEVLFWLGVLIVGKEAAQRYRQYFNPRRLWQQIKNFWNR